MERTTARQCFSRVICLSLLFLCMVLPPFAHADKITVAVAANFKPVLELLVADFTRTSSIRVQISSGSTGAIYARIKNGAPYDVFLSADRERPRLLEQAGMTRPQSRYTYAIGRLALWMPGESVSSTGVSSAGISSAGVSIAHLKEMASPLAIADPKLAPYGRAAIQTLQLAGLGNFPIVQGKNVSQVATFIKTGNINAGFIALSQIKQMNISASHYWLVPASWHQPIEQQLVVLHRGHNMRSAAFVAFLKSPEAKAIIKNAGYEVPGSD